MAGKRHYFDAARQNNVRTKIYGQICQDSEEESHETWASIFNIYKHSEILAQAFGLVFNGNFTAV